MSLKINNCCKVLARDIAVQFPLGQFDVKETWRKDDCQCGNEIKIAVKVTE